jgi:aminoglycoside phosphotransferase (APT) family kinase protein
MPPLVPAQIPYRSLAFNANMAMHFNVFQAAVALGVSRAVAQCLLVKKADITPELVSRLVAAQFPHWADLPVRPVDADGWDNATFRLGEHMSVRLPSSQAYAEQVDKEHRWLPILASQLPLPIPEPLAKGKPGCGFPRPWSVYRWIDGQAAAVGRVTDLPAFAADLADFLAALYKADPSGGPLPGTHNFFRGGPPAYYDAETRAALAALHGQIDTDLAAEVWEAALAATWDGPPVWFHGDAQPGNLLIDASGRLSAVIDFGTSGIGDPACDTTIAWTFLSGDSQRVFKQRLPADDATWTRGRGWAIWKAMIVLVGELDTDPHDAAFTKTVIEKILADHLDAQ